MNAEALPLEEHLHSPEALRRILAYRIRFAVTIGPTLSLRTTEGRLDPTAIAIELSMRDKEGLPHFIHELDAPPEQRNPDPWAYCSDVGCSACMTAVSAHLTPRGPERLDGVFEPLLSLLDRPLRPWVYRATAALTAGIDRLTAALAAWRARR